MLIVLMMIINYFCFQRLLIWNDLRLFNFIYFFDFFDFLYFLLIFLFYLGSTYWCSRWNIIKKKSLHMIKSFLCWISLRLRLENSMIFQINWFNLIVILFNLRRLFFNYFGLWLCKCRHRSYIILKCINSVSLLIFLLLFLFFFSAFLSFLLKLFKFNFWFAQSINFCSICPFPFLHFSF